MRSTAVKQRAERATVATAVKLMTLLIRPERGLPFPPTPTLYGGLCSFDSLRLVSNGVDVTLPRKIEYLGTQQQIRIGPLEHPIQL